MSIENREEKQELYIYMDDSGKINKNENSCIYGGLFFFSSKEYNNFIIQYKNIITKIKCLYCNENKNNCSKSCVEIKGNMKLSNGHRRWIYNLMKKQKNFGVFIDNKSIYQNILDNKSSRGRFSDYAQKRIVKEIVLYSIRNKKIDINKPLNLYIKIDQCKTKTNGYYNLKDSIYEELVNGIINYDYSFHRQPILRSELNIKVDYLNSKYNYGIQSADMIANYLHRQYELSLIDGVSILSKISFIDVKLFLP